MASRIKSVTKSFNLLVSTSNNNSGRIVNSRTIFTNSIKKQQQSSNSSENNINSTKSTNICPSCSSSLPFKTVPICPNCSNLLPPPSKIISYFTLFNLSPNSFEIDLNQLKNKFREYQQKVHPDLFLQQGEEKVKWARDWSMRVNNGWKILENFRSRGEYLLEQNGISIEEGESLEDPELLMIIMETRENLEEAKKQSEVDEIRRINKENIEETILKLSNAFGKNPPNLQEAKNLVIKLRYLNNVDEVCREWVQGKSIDHEIKH